MQRARRFPLGRGPGVEGVDPGAAFWFVVVALVLVAAYPTEELALARGALLAVPFTMVAAWRGWRPALLLAPLALAALWGGAALLGRELDANGHLVLAVAAAIAILAGERLRRVWSEHERRTTLSERHATLLRQATLELNQAATHDELYETALRLLSDILRFDHAEVFEPRGGALVMRSSWAAPVESGFSVDLRSVIGRAYRTGEPQHVPNTALDHEFVGAPGHDPARAMTEVAIPLSLGDDVVAVLNLEHVSANAFDERDRSSLMAFARIMEEGLLRIAALEDLSRRNADHAFLARINQELLHADSAGQAAGIALAGLLEHVPISAAAVATLAQGRLRPIAIDGELPLDFARHGAHYEGVFQRVWESGVACDVDDLAWLWASAVPTTRTGVFTISPRERGGEVAMLVPVVDAQSEVQALLIATMPTALAKDERIRQIVDTVSASLAVSLSRAIMNRRLVAVLEVVRRMSRSGDPSDLLQQAAEAAVELIPDAEAATVLVRDGDLFHFAGGVGYDLAEVIAGAGPFSDAEQLTWYGGSRERYLSGVARVIRGASIQALSFASSPKRSPANVKSARVPDMKANVLVPITIDDEVVALLNVDNFSTEHAFGSSAVKVAEAYAQHIAVIVRQAQRVKGLEQNLVTDGLTGLGNRVGLQRAMAGELERARRYSQPLNFVMIDLDGFKAINDSFGHAVGDQALKVVAEVLKRQVRNSDLAFRWGGDEFAVILPGVDRTEAGAAAQRFADLIGEIEIEGQRLSASVGIASFPDDGADPEALLKFADALMYQDKARGQMLRVGT